MNEEQALAPVSPGEILREEFLEPLGISAYRLARLIHVTPTRVHEILNARRGITADTAQRLARYFGTSPGFWLNMQSRYELDLLRQSGDRTELEGIRPLARPTPKELAAA